MKIEIYVMIKAIKQRVFKQLKNIFQSYDGGAPVPRPYPPL